MSIEMRAAPADLEGRHFYFGTDDNPFNFFNIDEAQITDEQARILADGGIIHVATRAPYPQWRLEVESQNQKLAAKISQQRGRLPPG